MQGLRFHGVREERRGPAVAGSGPLAVTRAMDHVGAVDGGMYDKEYFTSKADVRASVPQIVAKRSLIYQSTRP